MTNPPSKFDRWVYHQADHFLTPVLKVVNRALLALVKRLAAYNAKRGKPMTLHLDGWEVTGEVTDFVQALKDAAERDAKRGPNDVG